MPKVDWQEELHPRDEGGKFASSESHSIGEARGVGVARAIAAEQTKQEQATLVALDRFKKGLKPRVELDAEGRVKIPPNRKWISIDKTDLPKYTWTVHFDKDPEKGGQPSPERKAAVHDVIVKNTIGDTKPVAPGKPKIAILTMGAPASGKSSSIAAIDTDNYVKVDPDLIKEQIPEYQKALHYRAVAPDKPGEPGTETSVRESAAMVHAESSYIAKRARREAIESGRNVVIDGTGSNRESFGKLIDDLHAKGYRVHVAMADLDAESGLARMEERAAKCGRFVPPEILHDGYNRIPGNFEDIARKADSFELWDTRKNGDAKLVWEGGKGLEDTIHDEDRVTEFKMRADSQRAVRAPPLKAYIPSTPGLDQ